jgi:hypothetical protein
MAPSFTLIVSDFVMVDLGGPACQIFTVEKNLPFRLGSLGGGFSIFGFLAGEKEKNGNKKNRKFHFWLLGVEEVVFEDQPIGGKA